MGLQCKLNVQMCTVPTAVNTLSCERWWWVALRHLGENYSLHPQDLPKMHERWHQPGYKAINPRKPISDCMKTMKLKFLKPGQIVLICCRETEPVDYTTLRSLIQTFLVSLSSWHTDVLTSNIGLASSHIHLQLTCQHVLKVNCPLHEIFTSL